jgi:hypothetical protein
MGQETKIYRAGEDQQQFNRISGEGVEWSSVPWDAEQRITMLARATSSLAVIPSGSKKRSPYTGKQTPPLVKEQAPLLNTFMSKREQKSWSDFSTRMILLKVAAAI